MTKAERLAEWRKTHPYNPSNLSKDGVLRCKNCGEIVKHEGYDGCGQSIWICGYCKEEKASNEAMKFISEIQNPNTSEERRNEMFLEQDKEMVLGDLKSCPLTREQVSELSKLRDSFSVQMEE